MYGLVLEGGGARGSYQIGAYKALIEEGIEIGAIAGTSVGALNGALLAQGDYELLLEIWENLSYDMVIDVSEEELEQIESLGFNKTSFNYIKKSIKEVLADGGLDISPLKKMIDEYVDEDKIRKSGIDLGIVTVNVSDLKPKEIFLEDMEEGELKKYLLASAYLPVFKSEKLGGSYYLDGAFYDNLPFGMLRDKGYEKLILVRIHGSGVVKKIKIDEEKHIVISPREDLGGVLECDSQRSRYNMKLGYYDAKRALKNLGGSSYYISSDRTEEDYFNFFLELGQENIRAIGELLGLKGQNHRRLIFEEIIPKLAFYLNLDKDYGYRDVYLGLLEASMEDMGLERFTIYKEEDLLEKVREHKLVLYPQEEIGIFDRLKKTVETITSLNRDELVLKVSDLVFKSF